MSQTNESTSIMQCSHVNSLHICWLLSQNDFSIFMWNIQRLAGSQVKVITQSVLVHFSIQPCFHGKRTPSIPQRFSGFKDLWTGVVGICVSVLWSMTATPSMATATEMTLLPPLIRLSSRASRPCQLSLFIWWHSIYIISNQLHVHSLSLSLSLSLSPSLPPLSLSCCFCSRLQTFILVIGLAQVS